MKSNFLFVLFLFSYVMLSAQEFSKEFDQIRLTDFDYQFKEDPEAEAVILFDKGHTRFIYDEDVGYLIKFTRTKRIKINKKSGLKYADISIPYYVEGRHNTERVQDIEAYTYNLEGSSLKKTKLDKKNLYKEKVSENWHQYKFAFPNAQEGSIIEYQYSVISPFVFNLPDWEFQSRIPTAYSSYIAELFFGYEYVYVLQGINKLSKRTSKQSKTRKQYFDMEYRDMIHEFVLEDVPAFKDESFISTIDDYIIKLDFQLAKINSRQGSREIISTYPKLIKALMGHEDFGKYLKKVKKVSKDILPSLNLVGKDDLAKSKTIINYVKDNFKWNGKHRKFCEQSPKTVFQQKKGSTAELNLLLTALLQNAEIEAFPVIYSSRSHGKINKTYPFSHQFNSVVVFVNTDNGVFLADACFPLVSYNRIAPQSINDQGLIVQKDITKWVTMYSKIDAKTTRIFKIKPNIEKGKIEFDVANTLTETAAYFARNKYKDNTVDLKNSLQERNFDNISKLKIAHYRLLNRPYKYSFKAEMPYESFDNKILISPFLNYPPQENLLKQKNRTYPVDLIYKRTNNFGSEIIIPEGYKALDLPENLSIDNNLVRIIYGVKKEASSIKVTASIIYKKAIYQPKDYVALKKHMETVVEKLNEQIVLEKN